MNTVISELKKHSSKSVSNSNSTMKIKNYDETYATTTPKKFHEIVKHGNGKFVPTE